MLYVTLVGILRVVPVLGSVRLDIIDVGVLFVIQSIVWYLAWLRLSVFQKQQNGSD